MAADRGAEVDEVAAQAAQAAAEVEAATARSPMAAAAAAVGSGSGLLAAAATSSDAGTKSAGAAAGMKPSDAGMESAVADRDAGAEATAEAFCLTLLAGEETLVALVTVLVTGNPSSETSALIQGAWSVSVAVARLFGL